MVSVRVRVRVTEEMPTHCGSGGTMMSGAYKSQRKNRFHSTFYFIFPGFLHSFMLSCNRPIEFHCISSTLGRRLLSRWRRRSMCTHTASVHFCILMCCNESRLQYDRITVQLFGDGRRTQKRRALHTYASVWTVSSSFFHSRSIFSVLNFSFGILFLWIVLTNNTIKLKEITKCARERNAFRSVTEILPISWHCWLWCACVCNMNTIMRTPDIDCVGHENTLGRNQRRNWAHCASARAKCVLEIIH